MYAIQFDVEVLENIKMEIDFILLWVDCNDAKWQKSKNMYRTDKSMDVSTVRYQSWDNLVYWFRGVDKYAPWVRKIHFVTCGQTPPWLNTSHPKIHLVNHSDYIPVDALPTFNSNAIEIGVHKISGLSEHFVLFNDDMFLTAPIEPEYYFHRGIPRETPGLTRPVTPVEGNVFSHSLCNNRAVINRHFKIKRVLKKNWKTWLNPLLGKTAVRTLLNMNRDEFPGFVMPHLSTPYIKDDFERVWNEEKEVPTQTQYHRFRSYEDVSHFLFRDWRMCSGQFYSSPSKGKYFSVASLSDGQAVAKAIAKKKYQEICINEQCSGNLFEEIKKTVNQGFQRSFPNPSSFERPEL